MFLNCICDNVIYIYFIFDFVSNSTSVMKQKESRYRPTMNGNIQGNMYRQFENNTDNDNNGNGFTYEHFPVVCPSCKGTGEIEKDSSEMVTFVPVKDERLKPARTKLKIFIMVVIFAVAASLATFFLYPRSVKINVEAQSVLDFLFLRHKTPWIKYRFDVTIENNYYVAISVKEFQFHLLYQQHVVGTKNFSEQLVVGLRDKVTKQLDMNVSYDGLADQLWKQCYVDRDFLGQVIRSSGELSYWMSNEHLASKQDYFYADCGQFIFPEVVTTTKQTSNITTTTSKTTIRPVAPTI